VAKRREKSNQVWPGANTRRWHVHDGPVRCNSRRWSARVHWLPWQQLQLVLRCVNNYGKLSSNVAGTIRSNGIDIGRCLRKLLAIICVPGFFLGGGTDTVYKTNISRTKNAKT